MGHYSRSTDLFQLSHTETTQFLHLLLRHLWFIIIIILVLHAYIVLTVL